MAWAGRLLLAHETRPWTLSRAMRWDLELRNVAKRRTPSTLSSNVLVDADEYTYTIYDGYPKAQYHFLIVPRLPCSIEGKGPGGKIDVTTNDLNTLSTLLASGHAEPILERLARASERVRPYVLTPA
ncbi:hypothetical protein ACI68E_003101 [Malassezia pachydermatis]